MGLTLLVGKLRDEIVTDLKNGGSTNLLVLKCLVERNVEAVVKDKVMEKIQTEIGYEKQAAPGAGDAKATAMNETMLHLVVEYYKKTKKTLSWPAFFQPIPERNGRL